MKKLLRMRGGCLPGRGGRVAHCGDFRVYLCASGVGWVRQCSSVRRFTVAEYAVRVDVRATDSFHYKNFMGKFGLAADKLASPQLARVAAGRLLLAAGGAHDHLLGAEVNASTPINQVRQPTLHGIASAILLL